MHVGISAGAVALGVGGLMLGLVVVRIAMRPVIGQSIAPDVAALGILATVLLTLGLPAMYAVQADATGVPGLVAHALLAAGLLLIVVVSATPLLYPSLGVPTIEHPLVFGLGIAFTIGLLLTGIVTFTGGVLPKPAAGLLLAAMAGFFFAFFVAEFLPPAAGQIGTAAFGIFIALGFAWIAASVWQLASAAST